MSSEAMKALWRALSDRHDLTVMERLILAHLASYADPFGGTCYPGIRRIARECGTYPRTVQRVLKRLRDRHLIKVEHPARRNGATYGHNGYRLTIIATETGTALAATAVAGVPDTGRDGTPSTRDGSGCPSGTAVAAVRSLSDSKTDTGAPAAPISLPLENDGRRTGPGATAKYDRTTRGLPPASDCVHTPPCEDGFACRARRLADVRSRVNVLAAERQAPGPRAARAR